VEHETPDDATGEAIPHLKGDAMTVRSSQIGRLEAERVDVAESQVGSLAADRAEVSGSKVGFAVARELHTTNTETGIVIAFSTNGQINTQIEGRSVVLAAAAFAAVLFVLGRVFRRG